MAGIAMVCIAISSCSEDTVTLGDTLTRDIDKFQTLTSTYQVKTHTLMTDSVLGKTLYNYLGKIKDPETGTYITSDYMTKFHILENEYSTLFPAFSQIAKDNGDNPIADSCSLRIMINSYQGDSLIAMKLRATELAKPVPNGTHYYSNFNPAKEGYLRTDNAIRQTKVYAVSDLTKNDSTRNVLRGSNYYEYVTIPLKDDYIDKDGNLYEGYNADKNQGTGFGNYLLRTYYAHPEYFKSSTIFANKVCPGFYIESIDGLGNMLEVANTQITVFFHYTSNDTTVITNRSFLSTPEVLRTNHITNDKSTMKQLASVDTCTFLKSPSALYTEVELPIDSIKWLPKDGVSHENDTILQVKVTFQQYRAQSELSDKLLDAPTDLLLIQRDSLYSFFESNQIPNNVTSYLATYNSTQKTYSFSTLSSLVDNIYTKMKPSILNSDGSVNLEKVEAYKQAHPNWNKVVLVPVDIITTATSSTSSSVTAIYNSMAISSVRLIGGENSKHGGITMNVMYSRNN